MGYIASESVEEYTALEDELKLSKKKVTKKHIPPDISALKVLLTLNESKNIGDMTDGELEEEKRRLLKLLKEYESETENENTSEYTNENKEDS